MIRKLSFLVLLNLLFMTVLMAKGLAGPSMQNSDAVENGDYIAVVEGYDWGAAVSKVILTTKETVSEVNMNDFVVQVEKTSDCGEIPEEMAKGERTVIYAYVSDKEGNKVDEGNCITLTMSVAPNMPVSSPIHYFRGETCNGNKWVGYHMTITNTSTGDNWTNQVDRIIPLVDKYDLAGTFTHGDITLTYASYEPKPQQAKSPLIIWLHGGGEGGTDPTIPLLGNRAANYASDEIQFYFDGAYVLVPQTSTRWMDAGEGVSINGGALNDIYNEALLALIKDFVAAHPGIDANRIYVGGCSNGGYMSLKLLLVAPDYFAAGFISSLAYRSQNITDEQIESIKNIPIWFVQSADDQTTTPETNVLPTYKRLIQAGAPNVHLSFYEHVVDITGFFGGDGYLYTGHWSWVYLHANKCRYDYDGSPVRVDGKPVTVMEWLAAQKK